MRTQGSPEELEHRRQLAVQRLTEGYSVEEVAEFFDVSPRTVRRWRARFRGHGPEELRAHPVQGRFCKLTPTQEKIVLRWWRDNPLEYGFATELWSAPRLAQVAPESSSPGGAVGTGPRRAGQRHPLREGLRAKRGHHVRDGRALT